MANAGRILILPKGTYDSAKTYEMLDLVSHNGTTWIAKKTVVGIEPSEQNSEYWQCVISISVDDVQQLKEDVQQLKEDVQALQQA